VDSIFISFVKGIVSVGKYGSHPILAHFLLKNLTGFQKRLMTGSFLHKTCQVSIKK